MAGRVAYDADQLDHQEAALSLAQYLGTSEFRNRTLQNWQPESKPVGASDESTGVGG